MYSWIDRRLQRSYERLLRREIGDGPAHVAIIQDGNRRYARKQGQNAPDGHREGADTSEQVLEWCEDLEIEELTLYAFSTENFNRPAEEQEPLFDIIESKLYELADSDRVHENGVCLRAIGEIDRLPERVQRQSAMPNAKPATTTGFDSTLRSPTAVGTNCFGRPARSPRASTAANSLRGRSMFRQSNPTCIGNPFETSILLFEPAATNAPRTFCRGTPTATRQQSTSVRPTGRSSRKSTFSEGFERTSLASSPGNRAKSNDRWR